MQSIFFLDYPSSSILRNTLSNLRLSYIQQLSKTAYVFFRKSVLVELNSRISSDITQIQDTLTSTIAEF
jgi:ABC-type multidrug transport system fused ATPase/permease subunit